MSLGRTGHCAHSVKWCLKISHGDSGWAELKISLVGS